MTDYSDYQHMMNRRQFLQSAATTLALATVHKSTSAAAAAALPSPTARKLPRWRGFNLTEKFVGERNQPYRERDFEWIAHWGFNFVRLPMSYRCWSTPEKWRELNERVLKEVDEAVEFGRRHGVHVNLNLHRAPGYCVNPPKEPLDLWQDETALEASCFHWAHLAHRFKGVPNVNVSFDLLNEPADIPESTYSRVVTRLVESIRAEDPHRLIIADGLKWGRNPVSSLSSLGIAQSTRGYDPMRLSHWRANWVRGSTQWPQPDWPLTTEKGEVWDKERLRRERIGPWQALEKQGVGVHVGEWGAFSHTPHKVVLTWMRNCLELWKEAGWGWALWNFAGAFGVLDSNRRDVLYEEFQGHKLDREMLGVLCAG
jgi:endoglucanase